ncbi:MAG: hypothetical protein WCF65_08060, partial [Parachlamydiaceae bacterium]
MEKIARPAAAWFIAYGKGQETNNFYKDETHPSPWLKEFLQQADANFLKRSFRNSTKAFLLAQTFWEKFPNLIDAKEWLKGKFSQQTSNDNQFELDLEIPQSIDNKFVELIKGADVTYLSQLEFYDFLKRKIDYFYSIRGDFDVLILYLPNSYQRFRELKDDTTYFDLHDSLKLYCAKKNIKIQMIEDKSIHYL